MTTQTLVFPVYSCSCRWLKNSLIGFGATTLVLAALGTTYQSMGTALDRQRYPAPGELVSIGWWMALTTFRFC